MEVGGFLKTRDGALQNSFRRELQRVGAVTLKALSQYVCKYGIGDGEQTHA